MEKKTVKDLTGSKNDKAVIVSENGMAVAYTGDSDFEGFIRTELGAKYGGEPQVVYSFSWRNVKAQLELEKVSEIRKDGKFLYFGGVSVECEPGKGLFLPEKTAGKKEELVAAYNLDTETTATLLRFSEYASKDEMRYFMNGVFLAKNGDIAATDGRRLGVLKTDFKFGKWIVKHEVFQKLKKAKEIKIEALLPEPGVEVLRISGGGTTILCSPIDRQFPSYEKVIPDKFTRTEKSGIEFDYAKFKDYIKEKTGGKDNPGTVVLYKESIWCWNIEVGKLNFQTDKPMFFNPQYLADALKDGGNISWNDDGKESLRAVLFGTAKQMSVVMPKSYTAEAMPSKIDDKENTDD